MRSILNLLKRRFFKNSAQYVTINLFAGLIPFLILPVLTRHITPFDLGVVNMYLVLTGLLQAFVNFGAKTIIFREFYRTSKEIMSRHISCSILIAVVSTACISIIILFFRKQVASFTSIPPAWLWAVSIALLAQAIFMIIQMIATLLEKPHIFGITHLGRIVFAHLLILVLVIYFNMDWKGMIIGHSIAFATMIVGSLIWISRLGYFNFSFDKKIIISNLLEGGIVLPHTLATVVLVQSDRFFLNNLLGTDQVGIYSIAATISNGLFLMITSISQASFPAIYRALSKDTPNNRIKLAKMLILGSLGCLFLAAIMAIVSPPIIRRFLSPAFHPSTSVVGWLLFAMGFKGVFAFWATAFIRRKLLWVISGVTIATAGLYLVGVYLLVNRNGFIGAGQASLYANGFSALVIIVLSIKLYSKFWKQMGDPSKSAKSEN